MIRPIERRQGDTLPPITIEADFDLAGFSAVLKITQPDGLVVDYPSTILGQLITIPVTAGMTATVGRYPARLVLTSGTQVLSLPNDESWYLDVLKFGG